MHVGCRGKWSDCDVAISEISLELYNHPNLFSPISRSTMRRRICSPRLAIRPLGRNSVSRFSTASSSSASATTEPLSSRWLHDLRGRIGRCIQFGLKTQEIQRAGKILEQLNRDWRELVAGSEGFLTDKDHRGLYRQEVVWGEMVGSSAPMLCS